ncbi:MAG TPA: bifunctional 5,10-methylenetetrahydrofolate dehydrogenase/5,10-methenyltetrahydrofolate cyclohydrolase [Ferruginibacter sp.]|nr:bifunctional 5,10-methylenetetrahydrofolate dehydrogenase/5,10-methenyltetrahydrofolate cyclohydrolase [Ferruginibacter sp.]
MQKYRYTPIVTILWYFCAMQLLDGKVASAALREKLKKEVAGHVALGKRPPHLVAILVGNDGASETYVASKIRNCNETGFKSSLIRFPADVEEQTLVDAILHHNNHPETDGILVQLPLPAQLNTHRIIVTISPDKDVDGFHPVNAGKMMLGEGGFVSATPLGIMHLLQYYNIETSGKHAVVIGRSNIVGRPMSVLLSANANPGNCTVTLTHSRTKDLPSFTRNADIIVAALGIPAFLKKDMVKPGAVVMDVGITRIPDATKKTGFRLQGDVDFDAVAPLCSYITPVPGGVGLMTIGALLQNTYQAYLNHIA